MPKINQEEYEKGGGEIMRLRRGDIVLNKWAGENNPVKHFVYLETSGRFINGITLGSRNLKKAQYYKNILKEEYIDGSPSLEVVGHTEAFNILKEDLKIANKRTEK